MPPETPVKHRRLRGHVDAYRCCVKSLIGSALVGFDVRQHARAESISKRAPSTTRTSLRLESTTCSHARRANAAIVISPPMCRDHLRAFPSIAVAGRRRDNGSRVRDRRARRFQTMPVEERNRSASVGGTVPEFRSTYEIGIGDPSHLRTWSAFYTPCETTCRSEVIRETEGWPPNWHP